MMLACTLMDREWLLNNFLHGIVITTTFICIYLVNFPVVSLAVSSPDSNDFDVDSLLNLSHQSDSEHFDTSPTQIAPIAVHQPVHAEDYLMNSKEVPILKQQDEPVKTAELSKSQKRRLAKKSQGIEAIREIKRKKDEANRLYRERLLKNPQALANYKKRKSLWSRQNWINLKKDPQKHAEHKRKNKEARERKNVAKQFDRDANQ